MCDTNKTHYSTAPVEIGMVTTILVDPQEGTAPHDGHGRARAQGCRWVLAVTLIWNMLRCDKHGCLHALQCDSCEEMVSPLETLYPPQLCKILFKSDLTEALMCKWWLWVFQGRHVWQNSLLVTMGFFFNFHLFGLLIWRKNFGSASVETLKNYDWKNFKKRTRWRQEWQRPQTIRRASNKVAVEVLRIYWWNRATGSTAPRESEEHFSDGNHILHRW